jgi:hypothetical protein
VVGWRTPHHVRLRCLDVAAPAPRLRASAADSVLPHGAALVRRPVGWRLCTTSTSSCLQATPAPLQAPGGDPPSLPVPATLALAPRLAP